MSDVNICEMFESIQGESSYAGDTCFFVRLSGCNLRCKYCDTVYAYDNGKDYQISDIVEEAKASQSSIVEITGGEPLLQTGFVELATELRDKAGKTLLVETNGSMDISSVPEGVICILDVKCPGSGEEASFNQANIDNLRDQDEVKFVIMDRADYYWARDYIIKHELPEKCKVVHMSPVHGDLDKKNLEAWVAADGLDVNVQVQLHKIMGIK